MDEMILDRSEFAGLICFLLMAGVTKENIVKKFEPGRITNPEGTPYTLADIQAILDTATPRPEGSQQP